MIGAIRNAIIRGAKWAATSRPGKAGLIGAGVTGALAGGALLAYNLREANAYKEGQDLGDDGAVPPVMTTESYLASLQKEPMGPAYGHAANQWQNTVRPGMMPQTSMGQPNMNVVPAENVQELGGAVKGV